MPVIEVDGRKYEVKQRSFKDKRVLIKNPDSGRWHLLKAYAIVRDEDVYVMPIKNFLNAEKDRDADMRLPSFLGALPNLPGGNAEFPLPESKGLIEETLERELDEETHGKYSDMQKLTYLQLLWLVDPKDIRHECYAFYACDVRKSGTSTKALTSSEREMTGEHFVFSAKALLDVVDEMELKLSGRPGKDEVKEAILSLYNKSKFPSMVKSLYGPKSVMDEETYSKKVRENEGVFLDGAHTIDALAGVLSGQLSAMMKSRTEEKEKKRQLALKETRRHERRMQLMMILSVVMVIIVGFILGKVALSWSA
ncbi:hypothetical protein NVS55_19610 [Myxococcus stipitatus]|uniref:hypothetical protein n=1 Tax=Myxococcus stipitatus TaxID=83455 RepID=UPI0031455B7A